MHFCEGKAELFPLGENVFMPGFNQSDNYEEQKLKREKSKTTRI
jgi:hypothetical protein